MKMLPTALRTLLIASPLVASLLGCTVSREVQEPGRSPFAGQPQQASASKPVVKLAGKRIVTLYAGVAGVTYSPKAGQRLGVFPNYPHHESAQQLSPGRFEALVSELTGAGFTRERSRQLPAHSLPPMEFRIYVSAGGTRHSCRFYHRRGMQVPEKYLKILQQLPESPALRRFLSANREFGRMSPRQR